MESPILINFLRLRPDSDSDIPLPQYMTPGASGMDICAAIDNDLVIAPGKIVLIPTGFAMEIPAGFEAQIRPRSGLAIKHGVGVINSPGTIDADYRGEIKVALINMGDTPFTLRRSERIAQMVIQKIYFAKFISVESLQQTNRDSGGFGHTGR